MVDDNKALTFTFEGKLTAKFSISHKPLQIVCISLTSPSLSAVVAHPNPSSAHRRRMAVVYQHLVTIAVQSTAGWHGTVTCRQRALKSVLLAEHFTFPSITYLPTPSLSSAMPTSQRLLGN